MPAKKRKNAYVIVLGNEKGGTGKSTTAMHIAISLMKKGATVSTVDLDSRQQTLNRYISNRINYAEKEKLTIGMPGHHVIHQSNKPVLPEKHNDEAEEFTDLTQELRRENDFIVIDCPGNDTSLARLAHSMANTLITPMNDSFIDLDLLGHVDPETFKVEKLSFYSQLVWECRKNRAAANKPALDWVILRNRLSTTHAKNKKRMDEALKQLQNRIAFRYISGLSERVIYRELFPQGLTLMDLKDVNKKVKMSMSHIAARHEMRRLLSELKLPNID